MTTSYLEEAQAALAVAASGGWRSTKTLELFQQVDEQAMLEVVLGGGKLGDVKGDMHTYTHSDVSWRLLLLV